jgi:23S rRNA (uracil1939-C5)-methyltransferase
MTLFPHHKSSCVYFPICGGCDFLDLDEKNYRDLKKEIFTKTAGDRNSKYLENASWIWVGGNSRRRVIFQIDQKNYLGFFAAKTNDVVEINECFVAEKEISKLIPELKTFIKTIEENFLTQISVTVFDNGLDVVLSVKKEPNFSQIKKFTNFAKSKNLNISYRYKNHLTPIFLVRKNQIFYPNFKINLDSEIFIQATKSGLNSIIEIIRNELGTSLKNLTVVDLYAGFGAYSFAIVDLMKKIFAVEGDKKMIDLIGKNAAENNLSNKIIVETRDLFSDPLTQKELNKFDLAIINPPRNGASPQILEIAKSNLRNVIYISCNPQSFWRDAEILIAAKFKIEKIFILDQFYATKHLELIAIFKKNDL